VTSVARGGSVCATATSATLAAHATRPKAAALVRALRIGAS
jgi:hypothetical protein